MKLALAALMLFTAPALAAEPHKYVCLEPTVYDGDTVHCVLDFGLGVRLVSSVRLAGIDTPELNSPNPEERECARAAGDRLRALLKGREVAVEVRGKDKYGRVLGKILANGEDVAAVLIEEGLGRSYDGGRRRLPAGGVRR